MQYLFTEKQKLFSQTQTQTVSNAKGETRDTSTSTTAETNPPSTNYQRACLTLHHLPPVQYVHPLTIRKALTPPLPLVEFAHQAQVQQLDTRKAQSISSKP